MDRGRIMTRLGPYGAVEEDVEGGRELYSNVSTNSRARLLALLDLCSAE